MIGAISFEDALREAKRRGLGTKLRPLPKGSTIWTPLPGPQTEARNSPADELFYGGAAGGGKTDLLLGLAATQHWRSIIFRRIFPALRGIVDRSREILNPANVGHEKDAYNESLHVWRLTSGPLIEFGSVQYEHDKENYRGRPHDLYGWDELPEFTEGIFRFVNTWMRSTRPGQRCRIVATGNPPTSAEGEWVIGYWGPWLDPQYSRPAKPGELRWFARLDDVDVEVEDGRPFEHKGETIQPRSRTFIPARLHDNPILEAAGYGSVLQALPEPLRSQLLYGDFRIGITDDPWQVIPTEWIDAAIDRWKASERDDPGPLSSLGVDIARGGKDQTVLAPLHGTRFAALQKHPGSSTPNGPMVGALAISALQGSGARIAIDVIGVGSSVYDTLQSSGMNVLGVNFGEGSGATDRSGRLRFANKRAECYWQIREALDPDKGDGIALPDDAELKADLCSARWALRNGRIYIESKDEIKARLGRSTDCGDAVVIAWNGQAPTGLGFAYIDLGEG